MSEFSLFSQSASPVGVVKGSKFVVGRACFRGEVDAEGLLQIDFGGDFRWLNLLIQEKLELLLRRG